jgi:hypothetical protein
VPARPLTTVEIAELAEGIRSTLNDPNALMTATARQRWEGALAAIEFVLGETPRLDLGGHWATEADRPGS